MSYQDRIAVVAGADLTAKQFYAVTISGTVAGTVLASVGVLQEGVASGEDAPLAYSGRTRMKAGGAVSAGNSVGVNSDGFFVAVTSGVPHAGKALEDASSGGIFEGIVNFSNASYV